MMALSSRSEKPETRGKHGYLAAHARPVTRYERIYKILHIVLTSLVLDVAHAIQLVASAKPRLLPFEAKVSVHLAARHLTQLRDHIHHASFLVGCAKPRLLTFESIRRLLSAALVLTPPVAQVDHRLSLVR
jgi:hypothetical protein